MRKHNGFTLIELVVVVMILGILAAVAAPKLLNTSSTAADNGLKESLGTIRDAIERFAAEHAGSLPGASDSTEATFKLDLVPYLRTFPKCPVAGKNNSVAISTVAGTTTADADPPAKSWRYNVKDGTFICNSTGVTNSDKTLTYDSF